MPVETCKRDTSLKIIATNQTLGDASQLSKDQNVAYAILCSHLRRQYENQFFFGIANIANIARIAFCVTLPNKLK